MKRIAIIGKLIHIMDAQMPVPAMWGWFHILFVILTVVACAVLCKTYGEKKRSVCQAATAGFRTDRPALRGIQAAQSHISIRWRTDYRGLSVVHFPLSVLFHTYVYQRPCSSHQKQKAARSLLCISCKLCCICRLVRDGVSRGCLYSNNRRKCSNDGMPRRNDCRGHLSIENRVYRTGVSNAPAGFSCVCLMRCGCGGLE